MRREFLGIALAVVVSAAGIAADQRVAPQAKPKAPKGALEANADATRSPVGTMGIDGRPSTLVGCAGGSFYNTHPLGAAPSGTRIRVDVTSGDGIDPIATAAILQMGAAAPDNARMQYVVDDDSGGNRDPRLEFTLQFDANVVLSVGSYNGSFGCYWVKVEVTVP
jgi:hypothetical protein